MLLIITTGIAVTFLCVLVALYIIFRADKQDRLFMRRLEFSTPTGKPFGVGLSHDSRSAGALGVKASDLKLPFEISDNGGRRSGIDRRKFYRARQVPKRCTSPDRRRRRERRSGRDRRSGIKYREIGQERRGAFC